MDIHFDVEGSSSQAFSKKLFQEIILLKTWFYVIIIIVTTKIALVSIIGHYMAHTWVSDKTI